MARPLTKHDRNGNRYYRPPNIEATINEALNQDLSTLCQRAALDYRSPGGLPSECLVHLIRDAGCRGDQAMMTALLPPLLTRCEANLCAKITDDQFRDAAGLRDEALGEFSELFAVDGYDDNNNDLDFFEIRFNRAFRAFRIDFVRREIRRVQDVVSLPNLSDHNESTAYEDVFSRVSETFRSPASQKNTLFRNDLLKAINNLPPDERQAVVLCHLMGLEEESEDPEKTTAATLCGVTGRTIRNRLRRAAAKLLQFKEDTWPRS